MVLHNPNNWHWVNKDVSGWTREYLDKELTQISAEQDGITAKIDKVVSMDGDVDVSQRKGKVITIFDVKLKLEYSGASFPSCTLLLGRADSVGRQEQRRRRG
jgi:activator of HSP90 ATPase